jgi:hypothetical protein
MLLPRTQHTPDPGLERALKQTFKATVQLALREICPVFFGQLSAHARRIDDFAFDDRPGRRIDFEGEAITRSNGW